MRKLLYIATTSFSLLGFVACSEGPAGGPEMLIKDPSPSGQFSTSPFGEGDKVVVDYHLGPFNLPAGTSAEDALTRPARIGFKMADPIWATAFETDLADAEGENLPGELIHSVILSNLGEENTSCAKNHSGNPFAAATSNMKKIELPEGHGYPMLPTDSLEARLVLKNSTDRDYYNIFFTFRITGIPMSNGNQMTDVKPILIDTDPCEHTPVSIPPQKFIEKTRSISVPEAGSLVNAYGLLQDYGVSVSMKMGNKEDPFWEGRPELGEDFQILTLPPFEDPAGVPVSRGDNLELTVAYDNVSDDWYNEATCAAMVYLARTNEGHSNQPTPKKNSAIEVQKELLSTAF